MMYKDYYIRDGDYNYTHYSYIVNLRLNESRLEDVTVSAGRLFQSLMALG